MQTETVSPKIQVVIPRKIRDAQGLRSGQKIQAIQYDNRIELISIEPIASELGFLKGIDTSIRRESDRV